MGWKDLMLWVQVLFSLFLISKKSFTACSLSCIFVQILCVCVLFTYLFSLVKFAVQVDVVTQLSCWYNTFYSESHSNAPEWTEHTDQSDSDYVRKIVSLTWNNQFWLILQTDYELLVHFIILSYFIKDWKDFFIFKSVIEFLTNFN